MKICRFIPSGSSIQLPASALYGVIEGDHIREISGPPWSSWSHGARTWAVADIRLLAPVVPGKIICVGRNYAAHAAELGNEMPKEPLIFLKPPSSIVGPGEGIVLTKYSKQVEHESELGVVIGKRCSHLSEAEDPLGYVLGYVCVNDE